jgi:hypothetical protein
MSNIFAPLILRCSAGHVPIAALKTLPIIHKQGRPPIQAAVAIARAAIRS